MSKNENVNLNGNKNNSGYNTNNNSDTNIKNSRNVNIVHMDAKVLVYTWFISFLTVLVLAFAGYLVLDSKIEQNKDNIAAMAISLLKTE